MAFSFRPLDPSEGHLVREVFDGLSEDSRYNRFLNPKPRLSESDVRYLTRVGRHDHIALVAQDGPSGRPLGIGRLVRTEGSAELAIAVVDECHGHGLGSRLLDLLLELAAAAGVTRLEATTAAGNSQVLSMLQRRGFQSRPSSGPHRELVRG